MNPRLLAFPLLIALAACTTTTRMTDITPPGALPASDIAGIVATANDGEIQQGQAASSRASSSDVRAFAQMMVTDHTNALNTARDAFTRLGITPGENDTTRALRTTTPQAITNLATYRGAAYDRAYIQFQVDLHQWLLNALDVALIPSATGELRTLLQTQRTAVAAHLDRARQILGAL